MYDLTCSCGSCLFKFPAPQSATSQSGKHNGGCQCGSSCSDSFIGSFRTFIGVKLVVGSSTSRCSGAYFCTSQWIKGAWWTCTSERLRVGAGGYRAQSSHAVSCALSQQTWIQCHLNWLPWYIYFNACNVHCATFCFYAWSNLPPLLNARHANKHLNVHYIYRSQS